jgi:hypothetical protein
MSSTHPQPKFKFWDTVKFSAGGSETFIVKSIMFNDGHYYYRGENMFEDIPENSLELLQSASIPRKIVAYEDIGDGNIYFTIEGSRACNVRGSRKYYKRIETNLEEILK